jgi:hypothetical protein
MKQCWTWILYVEEPPFVTSDVVVDTGFISGVDPQLIATEFTLDVDLCFVEQKFMTKYDAAFGDERAEDSVDDRPVLELSNRD